VLRRLHSYLYAQSCDDDKQFYQQAQTLQWVTPKAFGVPDSDKVYRPHLWAIAIDKLK
jgi:hypothetical protein